MENKTPTLEEQIKSLHEEYLKLPIEGSNQKYVDGFFQKVAAFIREREERIFSLLKSEFMQGLRGWGFDFQREKLWNEFVEKNNLSQYNSKTDE